MAFAPESPDSSRMRAGVVIGIVYLAVAAAIGLYRIESTGPIWPDSPRYANAGILVRDWVRSGQWFRPMPFAIDQYARYPGFSAPYHPPGFPVALGGWFLIAGVSHESARAFMVLCWCFAGCLFYRINRELNLDRSAAFAAGLLLLTAPQLAMWSRDTMSEIPSLVPLFGATVFWLRWLRSNRPRDGLFALVLAVAAFFVRVTTAGVLPGIILFGAFAGGWTRRRYLIVSAGAFIYLAAGIAWTAFAARFAAHEVAADGKGSVSIGAAVAYFSSCWPHLLLNGTAGIAIVGLVLGLKGGTSRQSIGFWLAWLASYTAFKVAVPSTLEVRHFLTALPALAGLGAAAFPTHAATVRCRCQLWGLVAVGIAVNLWQLADCPRGVQGYGEVGALLARSEKPGNVLLGCWEDQDLLFRYRAAGQYRDRYFLRSDRTLAVRVSGYAHVAAKVLATNESDVFDVIRKGRVRYVVTCTVRPEALDGRPEEMQLLDRTVRAHPDLFVPIGRFPVAVQYVDGIHATAGDVWVWEFQNEVEDGPPAITIPIPTAGMEIRLR